MSIKKRRDSLLKSNLSINKIRDSAVNFTKGLMRSRQTASEIVNKTNENNKFKRTLIGNDNSFFVKRRENARRRQREDELEAATVQGTTKRQGSVVSRSTKGFLGRILDFFGIVLIGWFVNTLPQILKSIQGLIKRIQGVITILTGFMNDIGDFLISIGGGISTALQTLRSGVDLLMLRRQNDESLESANNNMNKVRKDMLTTGILYNNPAAAGLPDYSGETLLRTPLDDAVEEENKDESKSQDQKSTSDKNVEGRDDTKQFDSITPESTGTEAQKDDDPNNENFIQGIKDDKEIKQDMSDKAQSKGDTIDERNDENDLDNKKKNDDVGLVQGVKNFISGFFGGDGQQQSDNQKRETDSKKDNSSSVSGAVTKIKQIATDAGKQMKGEKKNFNVEPSKRERGNMNTNKNKNRNQVVIIEKGVPINNPNPPSGGGGGGSSLNSLDGLQDSDAMKKGIKKLQSVILAN